MWWKRLSRRRHNVMTYAGAVILCSTLLIVTSHLLVPQSHLQERLAIWWQSPQLQSHDIINDVIQSTEAPVLPLVESTQTDIHSANSLKKEIFGGESYNSQSNPEKSRDVTSQSISKATMMSKGSDVTLLPYKDVSLTLDERVDDLVGRMTLAEVAQLSVARFGRPTPGVARLNIKPFIMVTDCYQGQGHSKLSTSFPRPIGLAATFSPDLVRNISNVMAIELRAGWNRRSAVGKQETQRGLSCFGPLINILRHPLMAEAQDSFGEDVFLTSQMTSSFVLGLQGNHPRYIRVAAGCKYLAVHSGKGMEEIEVTPRDLEMTYLPSARACVLAGAQSIMADQTSISGDVITYSKHLLTDVLRTTWGFSGYVIEDQSTISKLEVRGHENATDHVSRAVHAGCNFPAGGGGATSGELLKAVGGGRLNETELRENVKPLLRTRMRLGEFDPPTMSPYSDLLMTGLQREKHEEQAVVAAMMSFVLLKNTNKTLPIWSGSHFKKVAVVGPFSHTALKGQVSSSLAQDESLTQGLGKLGPVAHAPGCDQSCDSNATGSVQKAVTSAEVVFVCLGEVETSGRTEMALPGNQLKLLQDVTRWAGRAPVILLLFIAGPVDISWAQASPRVPTILLCFLPGFGAGEALWRIVTRTGRKSAPAGRLPYTWPAPAEQLPQLSDFTMAGRTYRYTTSQPLYPFGYGLSYSTFNYTHLSVTPNATSPGKDVNVAVGVKNVGPYGAEEIVQVYLAWGGLAPIAPQRQLVGYRRVYLGAGVETRVSLVVKADQMSLWVDKGVKHTVLPGEMVLYAGGQQPHQEMALPSNVLQTTFTITR